jgi:hypothetical protein
MPSHAEPTQRATCKATTKAGKPCRKQAVDDGLCTFHSGKLDLAELGRRGGRARGAGKKEEQASDRLEARAYTALDELLTSGSATARVAAAKFSLERLTANTPAGLEVAKRALWLDQQEQTQQQMPAARAKLARLVESRATEMADERSEAELAERVERRAEERAVEMYAERMRLETEAVKAELRVDAPGPGRPPGGQPTTAEAIEAELRRAERERIERELEGR